MSRNSHTNHLYFLKGGGEMGMLTRSHPWEHTSLGMPSTWPYSLRNTIATLLHSKFPMFLFWGPDHLCFYNDAYRPSLGNNGKHPSALGEPGMVVFPEIWKDIKPIIDKVLNGDEAEIFEDLLLPIYRNERLEDVYWTFCYSAAFDDDGSIVGIIVICQETTQKVLGLQQLELKNQQLKKNADAEILARRTMEESEARFQNMAEATDILLAIADETSSAIYFNKAWTDLTGRTMKELLEFGWVDLIHPEDQEPYVNSYLSAYKFLGSFTGEFRVLNSKGEYCWLLAKVNPRYWPDGSFAGYISNCVDITVQKEQQVKLQGINETLLKTTDRLTLAIEAGELGLYEVNMNTDEIHTSDRFDVIFGSEKSTRRSDYMKMFHPNDIIVRNEAFKISLNTGLLDYTARVVLKNKETRWILVKGKVTGSSLLGIVQDITRSKELEFQKDSFLGIASHELKTPVTSIKAYTQVMEEMMKKANLPKYADMMRRIDKQANNLNSLITDLLDVTKINNGRLQMNLTHFNFGLLVAEIAEDMQRVAAGHFIQLELSAAPMVTADRERVGQVITNLISNAIKYSPGKGKINVQTSQSDQHITLCVQDFGIGIADSKKEKVFEQFYRVSGSREHTFPGLGLGLYISSEIVKRMDGKIWVNSKLGEGSTFCFSFPMQ